MKRFTTPTGGCRDITTHAARTRLRFNSTGALNPPAGIHAASDALQPDAYAFVDRAHGTKAQHQQNRYVRNAAVGAAAAVPTAAPGAYAASHVAASGSGAPRYDVGAGRDVRPMEKRAAILFTLSQLELAAAIDARDSAGTRPSPAALHSPSTALVRSDTLGQRALRRRLGALIKADPTDWQINELLPPASSTAAEANASGPRVVASGSGGPALLSHAAVRLTARPKGRWVKVSGKKVQKVETDDSQALGDPDKQYADMVQTYGTYRMLRGRVPVDRPLLQFSLYRENCPLAEAAQRLRRRTGQGQDKLAFASSKGGAFGCITQVGTARDVPAELLPHASRHYHLHPVIWNPLHYEALPPTAGEALLMSSAPPPRRCAGNVWRALLRCVDGSEAEITAALEHLSSHGAINYFPLSAFSASAGAAAYTLCAAVAAGSYRDACALWLRQEAERSPVVLQYYMQYLAAHDSTAAALLRRAADELRTLMTPWYLVNFLNRVATTMETLRLVSMERRPPDAAQPLEAGEMKAAQAEEKWREVWEALVHDTAATAASTQSGPLSLQACREACDAVMWNAAVSQRLAAHGVRVAAGDVAVIPANAGRSEQLHIVTPDDVAAGRFTIYDVVMPLPGVYEASSNAKHGTAPATGDDSLPLPLHGPARGSDHAPPSSSSATTSSWASFYAAAAKLYGLQAVYPHLGRTTNAAPAPFEFRAALAAADTNLPPPLPLPQYRRVVVRPAGLQYAIVADPNSVAALQGDMFLRQRRLDPLAVPLSERLRRPSPLNVSPAFREKMQRPIHVDPPQSEVVPGAAAGFGFGSHHKAPTASATEGSTSATGGAVYSAYDSAHPSADFAKRVKVLGSGDATALPFVRRLGEDAEAASARHGVEGGADGGAGRCSVAVECALPAGSDMTTLLREAFVLRHLHSADLLMPACVDR